MWADNNHSYPLSAIHPLEKKKKKKKKKKKTLCQPTWTFSDFQTKVRERAKINILKIA
jgi:hypothetical protein